jgi:hypothetical protein
MLPMASLTTAPCSLAAACHECYRAVLRGQAGARWCARRRRAPANQGEKVQKGQPSVDC